MNLFCSQFKVKWVCLLNSIAKLRIDVEDYQFNQHHYILYKANNFWNINKKLNMSESVQSKQKLSIFF